MDAHPPADLPTDLAAAVAALPDTPGCYLYKDAAGTVIYVGKAKHLRRRVASYFQRDDAHPMRTQRLVLEIAAVEHVPTDSEVEALLLENALIKDLQPRFNVKLKDDKTYPLLAISREEFPRVFVTRDRALAGVDFIGPFISMRDLNRAYHFLQRVFRFRNCDLDIHADDPARRSFSPCLNLHLKRCSAPCTLRIDAESYQADIRALRAFVGGRGKGPVIDDLRTRMKTAAAGLLFEDAARYRDQLQAIERLKSRGRLRDWDEPAAPTIDQHAGLAKLAQHLGLSAPPKVIEGFDIAHLAGQHVVAGLVQFVNGVPNKDAYRRFRIQGPAGDHNPGNNDFAAMREVVGRRYRRLMDEGRPLPDLVLIDGGHGQVQMARAAAEESGIRLPALVGLAKRDEILVRPDGATIAPGRRDPGLKLLMYVRDEAHRFCRRYFHLLQRKALKPDAPKKPRRKRAAPVATSEPSPPTAPTPTPTPTNSTP
jgi:excinuclease ABC subunit C